MREPQSLATLRAFTAFRGITLPFNSKKNNNPNFETVLLNSGDIKINSEEENDHRGITRALN
jgi:hypothetical protein